MIVTSSVDLLNGDAEAVLALVRELRERHGRIALVVIDTLARAMTGNENAPEDMGRFVAACGRIREAREGHVLVVHHCGKDQARGARGHSSLRAATDVELEVTNGEDGGCVRVTKHRDEAGRQELRLPARDGRAGHEQQGPRRHHLRRGRGGAAGARDRQGQAPARPEREDRARGAGRGAGRPRRRPAVRARHSPAGEGSDARAVA